MELGKGQAQRRGADWTPRPVSRCEGESKGLEGVCTRLAAQQGGEAAQAEIQECNRVKQLQLLWQAWPWGQRTVMGCRIRASRA